MKAKSILDSQGEAKSFTKYDALLLCKPFCIWVRGEIRESTETRILEALVQLLLTAKDCRAGFIWDTAERSSLSFWILIQATLHQVLV